MHYDTATRQVFGVDIASESHDFGYQNSAIGKDALIRKVSASAENYSNPNERSE